MVDDAHAERSTTELLALSDEPDMVFRIALDATVDRKALIRIAAWTTDMLRNRTVDIRQWLQYQWPYMTALDLVGLWAGKDKNLTELIGLMRLMSCAAIPAAIAAELCLRAASIPHSSYALGFAGVTAWLIAITGLLRVGVPWFYQRKLARMTEASAAAIIHAHLVQGAAKYPERIPLLLKIQRRYFGRLIDEERAANATTADPSSP